MKKMLIALLASLFVSPLYALNADEPRELRVGDMLFRFHSKLVSYNSSNFTDSYKLVQEDGTMDRDSFLDVSFFEPKTPQQVRNEFEGYKKLFNKHKGYMYVIDSGKDLAFFNVNLNEKEVGMMRFESEQNFWMSVHFSTRAEVEKLRNEATAQRYLQDLLDLDVRPVVDEE